ncbi:TetR/AcrR family transcriptional regulator [Streptomyces flavofungini]|uniref:TetR/AcrR family transcriptional regulator n=1 Tax=Streptomyces flavofungini TaxID=68200 RepID=UPI0025AED5DD|nr:TetR/AcrR family transcriptional regulator [Streptomyces flavofungini]WJV47454.1 TetR/AcrR family transcriptional regulator [Streptomyces flavofungini]
MQERAARTRALVIRAAAELFARDGYGDVTYRQIAAAAKVSVGSLTFHFASKSELADTIQTEGAQAARLAVERVTDAGGPALGQVLGITIELTRLLEDDVCAWAALRLTRERQGAGRWSELWLPTVRALLVRAHKEGQLRDSARSEDLLTLVEHLVGGAETYLRDRIGTRETYEDAATGQTHQDGATGQTYEDAATRETYEDAATRLERVWNLVLEGVAPVTGPQGVPAPRWGRSADAVP